jgi:hypothetical protein
MVPEEHDVDDSLPAEAGDGEDIGTFDPGETEDEDYGAEIDDLPEVGPIDPDEEPILDELEDSDG